MIILIDNFDSFTYNLYQYIASFGEEVVVLKNTTTLEEIAKYEPSHIVLSPGPGNPNDAGVCLQALEYFYQSTPILGVCLGHQVIGQFFGAAIVKAEKPMHGKVSPIIHDQKTIFADLPTPLSIVRYHSLIIDNQTLPTCLEISAKTSEQEIMAIRHKHYPVEGVQFHPESILSEHGHTLLENFFTKRKQLSK